LSRFKGTVKRDGPEELKKLSARAKKGTALVEVGVISDETYEDGLTVVEVAVWNEFGTKHIPERPFIRSTVKQQKAPLKAFSGKLLQKILDGKLTREKALGLLGQKVSGEIKETITSLRTPPNAPSTVEAKKSSNPLIDTGELRQSITFEVVDNAKRR
jgi:hypothetical protein